MQPRYLGNRLHSCAWLHGCLCECGLGAPSPHFVCWEPISLNDLHSATFGLEPTFGKMGSSPIPQHVSSLHLAMVCVHEAPPN